jgi:carbonic anhydrase
MMITRRELLATPLFAEQLQARDRVSAGSEAESALSRLMEGNRRFAQSMARHPDQNAGLRMTLSSGQHPFAAVLTCSDSRVAPELVFDQGLGDLFVIRVAGNILDDAVVGSIEYAAVHMRVPLVFVLGHQNCGAVQAALGEQPQAHIRTLVGAIRPVVTTARTLPGDLLDNAVRADVKLVVEQLTTSKPVLANRIAAEN